MKTAIIMNVIKTWQSKTMTNIIEKTHIKYIISTLKLMYDRNISFRIYSFMSVILMPIQCLIV